MRRDSKQLFELLLAAEREAVECRENPDLFFPEDWDWEYNSGMSWKARKLAKEMCGRCPIKAQCLQYAIDASENGGIWGGLTYKERLNVKEAHRKTR